MLQPTAPPEAFRPRLRHGVLAAGAVHVEDAVYQRNTQILVRGYAPLHRASPELTRALLA